jgi:hypothetical protein
MKRSLIAKEKPWPFTSKWHSTAREDCDLLSANALQPASPRTRGFSGQLHLQPTFSIRQLIGLPSRWMKSRITHTCRTMLTRAIKSIEHRRQVRRPLVCKTAGIRSRVCESQLTWDWTPMVRRFRRGKRCAADRSFATSPWRAEPLA